MISDRVRDLLIEQVGHELSAHQAYYGISLYFEGQSLKKWARLFHGQSVEEAQHATKIIAFLVDNKVPFDLPAIGAGITQYASARDAVQTALESEIRVTGQFNALAGAAQDGADHRALRSFGGSSRSRSKRNARCASCSASSTAGSTSLLLSSCSTGRRSRDDRSLSAVPKAAGGPLRELRPRCPPLADRAFCGRASWS